MKRMLTNTFVGFLFMVIVSVSFADKKSLCVGKFPNPITDICWDCLFPLSIGSMEVAAGDNPDTPNPGSPVCFCPEPPPVYERMGVSVGYWEPIALVDVTRHPFCMVNLGGDQLNMGKHYGEGQTNQQSPGFNDSFYHVHWYKYPVMYWLNVLTDGLCVQKGDLDIGYMSELDPTWSDDELAFIVNPEAMLFGDKLTQLACAADSIAALNGLPLDPLFWCAGSQGSMYPLDGHVQEHVSGVQASTLLAERMTYKLHREGLLSDSHPVDGPALCYEWPEPILPKSRYRYQMTYPMPTPYSCSPYGHTTALWGAWHEFPAKGEDFGYLIWRKRNCCAF